MGRIRQPTSYFGGGFTIDGDLSLDGDITLSPVRIGEGAISLDSTLVIGDNADATGSNSTAVGNNARALSQNTTAFGQDAKADGVDATALGKEALAPNNWNTVIGFQAGSVSNGANIVLIGRKSKGEGNDIVAIGENAIANGDRSTAVGKATEVIADNASAFGQGSTVDGQNTTVVGQGVTVNTSDSTTVGVGVNVTGSSATAVGVNSEATADNATAIGNGAVAEGAGAIALGENTTVSLPSAIGFGDRDIALQNSRSILFPTNAGAQTLVNLPVDDTISAGVRQEFTFDIGGEPIFVVRAESDGAGGIQNVVGEIKGSFALDGDTNQVDDVITGDISIRDGSGAEQIGLDATVTPVKIDLHNNRLVNFGIRSGEDITYPDDTGAERLVNFNVSAGPASGTEMSYSFAVDDTDIAKVFAEADGGGGIKNAQLRLIQKMNVNGSDILDNGSTIWDSASGHIPTAVLESDTVSLTTGTGIQGGGDFSLGGRGLSISLSHTEVSINGKDGLDGGTLSLLGGSVDVGITGALSLDADLEASNGTVLWDDSAGYIPTSVLQDDSVSLSVDDNVTSSGSVALGSSFSIGLADSISLTRVNADVIGDNGSSAIDFNIGGASRANMDSSGNLSIEGELTEGAAL